MILRPRVRPSSLFAKFESAITPQQSFQSSFKRTIVNVPKLGKNDELGIYYAENGVPGFLSSKTFKSTWREYQQHLADQINEKVEGTEYQEKSPYQLHIEFSRQPMHADLYNNAAMAWHNHLWWESLAPEKKTIPENLKKDIEDAFQSVENLRQEMLEHADAMFGNGFVWLVKDTSVDPGGKPLRILCTYNAGSPYSEAYQMRQNTDMATMLDPAAHRMNVVQNTVGSFGAHSKGSQENKPPNALVSQPLLCLNVWQHMWVPDYGITGKRWYLAAWWERINWQVVEERRNMATLHSHSYTNMRHNLGR